MNFGYYTNDDQRFNSLHSGLKKICLVRKITAFVSILTSLVIYSTVQPLFRKCALDLH